MKKNFHRYPNTLGLKSITRELFGYKANPEIWQKFHNSFRMCSVYRSPKNCFPSKKKLAENLPGVSVPLSNSQEREVTIKVDANVDGKPLMKNRWKSECYDKSNSVSLLYFPSWGLITSSALWMAKTWLGFFHSECIGLYFGSNEN